MKNKAFLAYALMASTMLVAGSGVAGAQQTNQPDPYQGTSNPPPDDTIITSQPPAPTPPPPAAQSKPSPSVYAQPPAVQPAYGQAVQPAYGQPVQVQGQAYQEQQPVVASQYPASQYAAAQGDGTDDGIVQVAPDVQTQVRPALNQRNEPNDEDGDIVHPAPLGPGQVGEGTTIRARLLDRLSTSDSQSGDRFRATVASDVLQGGQVLIPAGSEIDGRVTSVSSGHTGGHGSMHLSPETVILPDGTRYKLFAEVSGAPGSGTRVGNEGDINPGSRVKRNSIEYGGAVGAGAVTGAVVGGPAGALAGSLIGAGVITAHLLISHPQATLDSGTVLLFTLTERLNLVPLSAEAVQPPPAQ